MPTICKIDKKTTDEVLGGFIRLNNELFMMQEKLDQEKSNLFKTNNIIGFMHLVAATEEKAAQLIALRLGLEQDFPMADYIGFIASLHGVCEGVHQYMQPGSQYIINGVDTTWPEDFQQLYQETFMEMLEQFKTLADEAAVSKKGK